MILPFVVPSLIVSLLLSACGGGGGGTVVPPVAATTITGVAAAGAPVSKGIGYALDAVTGSQIPFITGSNGTYTVDLNGYSGPFLFHVRGITAGGAPVDLYSLATKSSFGKTVNVTPLSDVVVGYASGKTGSQLEASCTAALASCPALLNSIAANLAISSTSIVNALPATVLAAFAVDPATFNPISTPFTPNHTNVDALLDALQVIPPAAGGTSYAINLNASTSVPLITVPVSNQTVATAPTVSATPTAAANLVTALTEAANLVTALAEVQTFIANLSGLFATALPTSGQLMPYFDATYLNNGRNRATEIANMLNGGPEEAIPVGTTFFSGGLAPYSGGPLGAAATAGPNITYDANGCVTSFWAYFGMAGMVRETVLMKATIPGTNAPGVCTGGTWSIAGNQRNYTSRVTSLFFKQDGATLTYNTGFRLETASAETTSNNTATRVAVPYTSVEITGPGITTMAAPNGTNGTVTLIGTYTPNFSISNTINDPFYGATSTSNPYYPGKTRGEASLFNCAQMTIGVAGGWWNIAPTGATPCLNMVAVVAGGDYTITFKDANGAILEKDMQRLDFAPTSVPTSWYPTITNVTPAGATLTAAGGMETIAWTMPTGAFANAIELNVQDTNGSFLMSARPRVRETATSATVTVPALPAVPTPNPNGLTGLPGANMSYAVVITSIGGVFVTTIKPY